MPRNATKDANSFVQIETNQRREKNCLSHKGEREHSELLIYNCIACYKGDLQKRHLATNVISDCTFYSLPVLLPAPVKKPLTHGVNNEIQLPVIDCDADIGC